MVSHGTLTAYTRHGCRCDACRFNMSRYQKDRRERLKAQGAPCSVDECGNAAIRGGLCDMHYERRRKHGTTDDPKDAQRWRWADEVSYLGAHRRVYRTKGRAGDHECTDCGLPAVDWSYTGGDPGELIEKPPSPNRGCRYSVDPSFYVPRCRPCHTTHDKLVRRNA